MLQGHHLKLQKIIASGGAGAVWRALYKDTTAVAAKQLYSLRDFDLSEAAKTACLQELVRWDHWMSRALRQDVTADVLLVCLRWQANEVAVIGQLNHKHVVKFLGLCVNPTASASSSKSSLTRYEVYIVQELCGGNLRGLVLAPPS
mgnify:CR=1 FL=1